MSISSWTDRTCQPLPGCDAAGVSGRRLLIKALVVMAVVFTGLLLIYLSPLRDVLRDGGTMRALLEEAGPWAGVGFVFLAAVLVALGMPRLLLCPLAGAFFGFTFGLLYSQVGTLLGCYAAFVFVRWGGRGFVLHCWPRVQRFTAAFERSGVLGVFVARQMPAACAVINVALGLTTIRHRAFLGGTLLGILPEAIPATLLGAGIVGAMDGQVGWWKAAAAVVAMALIWLALAIYLRRSGRATVMLAQVRQLINRKE